MPVGGWVTRAEEFGCEMVGQKLKRCLWMCELVVDWGTVRKDIGSSCLEGALVSSCKLVTARTFVRNLESWAFHLAPYAKCFDVYLLRLPSPIER